MLLFLDEVQHLATSTAFENTTAALRTIIDKNKHWLKVIMTGSSQDNLQRLRTTAPFYNMTQTRLFPDLDAGCFASRTCALARVGFVAKQVSWARAQIRGRVLGII